MNYLLFVAMSLPTLAISSRTETQDGGSWIIDYQIRNMEQIATEIDPTCIGVRVSGLVSNSRIPFHSIPRKSSLYACQIFGAPDNCGTTTSKIHDSKIEDERCMEKLAISIPSGDKSSAKPFMLKPGETFPLRLQIDHIHIIYGQLDPLLANRKVEITISNQTLRDSVPLTEERHQAHPRLSWPEPPEERRDSRYFISRPYSLHLEAHVPGHQYYRFPEQPIRRESKMVLTFSYLIAHGSEGTQGFRLVQYRDTPTSWKILEDTRIEETLCVVGRWTKVERIFIANKEATTLTLEFKVIADSEIGEMWIDDVSLRAAGERPASGP